MPVYTFTTLDDPSATFGTTASGINNMGQIVGQYGDSSGHAHGFLLSGGIYTTLDDPSATFGTTASGINDMGQIVVQSGDMTDTCSETSPTHSLLVKSMLAIWWAPKKMP
jgi:probable HAF family extracellular repeat protein